jgi:mannose-6-phosphate isomerase-like protein (cupin superfamily)
MKASLEDLLKRIPGQRTENWPEGEPFAFGFRHGSMLLEVFTPRGRDRQTPHLQDEIYIVVSGSAELEVSGSRVSAKAGDCLFVAAGEDHRFHGMSDDFVTWVVFWGPEGGERAETA